MTRGRLPFRHAAAAAGLVLLFPLLVQACGGRNALLEGEADDGAGGFDASGGFGGEGGFGEGGFGGDGGFGGEGPVTSSVSSVSSTVSTNASSAVSSVASTSVSTAVSSSASSAVSSSASSAVSSVASTSVSTAVSSSVTTVTSASSAVSSSGVGGAPTTTGVGGFGGGGPLDCITCINNNCPQALQCITDPTCLQGATCTVQNCLGSGPPNFVCILNCFNGNLGTALQALGAIGCVANQCSMECQGLF